MISKSTEAYIKTGRIGVFPTDTLYGIVGSAFLKPAVKKIYDIKGRDSTKPLIILISSISDLKKFGITLSSSQRKKLEEIWPNQVSVILSCKSKKFEYLHRGTKSLAVRMPKSKKLQKLLKKTGPLVAPSANPQGKNPATTTSQAKKYFGDKIDFYVSGGVKKGKPSTIISFLGENITVLRQGAVRINITDK